MSQEYFAWVGTFSSPYEDKIYGFRYRPETGDLTPFLTVPSFANPAYIIGSRDPKLLYAVSDGDAFEGGQGAVAALLWNDAAGTMERTDALPTGGSSACHLALDGSGRYLYVANYGNGTLSVYALNEGGTLRERLFTHRHKGRSADPERQAGPHAHCAVFTPDGRWLCTADLGTDTIDMYRFEPDTELLEHDPTRAVAMPAGLGPRHIVFHPGGRQAYVVCELGSVVVVMDYDAAQGRLTPIEVLSTLPDGWQGESYGAAIRVTADGRFVYASNRGHDSIAAFAVDAATGRLSPIGITPSGGHWPRDIAIDPSGRYLFAANQESNTLVRFVIDGKDGTLHQSGEPIAVPHPACLCFTPAIPV